MTNTKYAAIIKKSRVLGRGYDDDEKLEYFDIIRFDTEEKLLDWIDAQERLAYRPEYEVIKYTNLVVTRKLELTEL